MTTRYHLSAQGQHVDQARTQSGAFVKAIYLAKKRGTRVRVFDRLAHRQRVQVWECRPFEEFARVVKVKQRMGA